MDRKEISAYQLSFSTFAPVLNYLLNSLILTTSVYGS